MEVKEIQDKNIWENFLLRCADKTFLQSWNWGEFQKLMGNKIWRLGVFDKEKIVGVALISKIKAKRGTFLLIQHGPSFAKASEGKPSVKYELLKAFLEELKKTAREEGASFIRMNPLWERRNEENREIFKKLGFRESPMHANAYEATWKLDITLSEEELLMNMRKTTRYLIRQAMKNPDITIEKSEKLSDIEIYQKLNKEMAERQKFIPFSFEYIKNEFEVFSRAKRTLSSSSTTEALSEVEKKESSSTSLDNEVLWLFGKHKGEIAAGVLVIFWSGIGFYHQAASLARYVKFSIPYLLQWEAIKEAKNRGCILYDFWGFVDPQKNPRHPWAGPTLFKMGFGGRPYEYVKTQDFPLSPKYWLTFIFEKMRKIKRGL